MDISIYLQEYPEIFVKLIIMSVTFIVYAIWDPHFGQLVVEAFTQGGVIGPVNIIPLEILSVPFTS